MMPIKITLAAALISLASYSFAQATSPTAPADVGSEAYPPSVGNLGVWSYTSVSADGRVAEKAADPVQTPASPAAVTPLGEKR